MEIYIISALLLTFICFPNDCISLCVRSSYSHQYQHSMYIYPQTPPRSITLDTYSYPGTEDLTPSEDRESSTPGSIPTMLPRPSSTTANSYVHPT